MTPQANGDVYVVKKAQQPVSQAVGSRFTFRVEVGVKGLAVAIAKKVVLEDELPEGLILDQLEETYVPFENGECRCGGQAIECRCLTLVVPVVVIAGPMGRLMDGCSAVV